MKKNFLRLLNIFEEILTNIFIHAENYTNFYKDMLKVSTMTEADFYVNILFLKIQNNEEEVTKHIFKLLVLTFQWVGILQEQNGSFKEVLKTIQFVETQKPNVLILLLKLYDPRNSDLVILFSLDKFPKLTLKNYYDHMVDCGMAQVIKSEHLKLVMKDIHQKKDINIAKALLLYLSKIINTKNLKS
jgi:hypothetical protein